MAGIADVVDMWDQLDSCFWLDVVGCRDVHCPIFSPVSVRYGFSYRLILTDSRSRYRETQQQIRDIARLSITSPVSVRDSVPIRYFQ